MTNRQKLYKSKDSGVLPEGAVTRNDVQMTNGDTKMTQVMTIPTQFDSDDDESSYKWSEIRDRLNLGSNVANARWMPEKLMPLFSSLDAPVLLTASGKPTKFCAQMIARYKRWCIDDKKDYETFAKQVRSHFPTKDSNVIVPELLADDESDDKELRNESSSAITVLETQLTRSGDNIEDLFMLAVQADRDLSVSQSRRVELADKTWEQQIVEDELRRIKEEKLRKKREEDIRALTREKVAQVSAMMENAE